MKLKQPGGNVMLGRVELARSFFARLRGLLGRSQIEPDYGMLLEPCGSVHMFFMKFPIDIFFLSGKENRYRVEGIKRNLKPWQMAFAPGGTSAVLETGPGFIPDAAIGDVFEFYR